MTRLAGERESDARGFPAPLLPDERAAADGPGGGPDGGVRASDAEREQVLDALGDGFVAGRLSHETFVLRVEATLRARRLAELDDQVADLRPGRRSAVLRARALLDRAGELGRNLGRELSRTVKLAADGRRRGAGPPPLMLPRPGQPRYTIGREWECDLTIGHPTVSRWHADLRPGAGGWWLADLGSLNGTRLNGWRISGRVLVRPGDVVSFGTASYVLTTEAPPGAPRGPGGRPPG
ncbi:MAG TPA: DUF1707 and FHA domain-containing protein [Streptosporangiaceae bacterium]|nr:DUF1707 and FHA domain-containing protein [Streptosporangiaceae bacterium]